MCERFVSSVFAQARAAINEQKFLNHFNNMNLEIGR